MEALEVLNCQALLWELQKEGGSDVVEANVNDAIQLIIHSHDQVLKFLQSLYKDTSVWFDSNYYTPKNTTCHTLHVEPNVGISVVYMLTVSSVAIYSFKLMSLANLLWEDI